MKRSRRDPHFGYSQRQAFGHPNPSAGLPALLQRQLRTLSSELAEPHRPRLHRCDIDFARSTLRRCQHSLPNTKALQQIAAGVAWERIVITHVHRLASRHPRLRVLAVRWKHPNTTWIDLDLILHDAIDDVIWVLDAKLARPCPHQVHKLQQQLRLFTQQYARIHDTTPIYGLLVHRARHLPAGLAGTEAPPILRCAVQQLAELVLGDPDKHLA